MRFDREYVRQHWKWCLRAASGVLTVVVCAISVPTVELAADPDAIEREVREAWDRAGADDRFELSVPRDRPTRPDGDERERGPTSVWLDASLTKGWANVHVDLVSPGAPVLAVEAGAWRIGEFEGPQPMRLRAFEAGDANARRFARQFDDLDTLCIVERAVPTARRVDPRPSHYASLGWECRGQERRQLLHRFSPPRSVREAREFTAYQLAAAYVGAAVRGPEIDPGDAISRVLTSAASMPDSLVNAVLDWCACHGASIPSSAWRGLDAWAAQARLPHVAEARRSRIQRARGACASALPEIGSREWSASFAAGAAGEGGRWRQHFALSADRGTHRRALIGCLKRSYPEAVEAALAMWRFEYLDSADGIEDVSLVPLDARGVLADGLIQSGLRDAGEAILESIVTDGAETWNVEPAWWGRAHWYTSAFMQLSAMRGATPDARRWRALLERTHDPFVAVAAAESIGSLRGNDSPSDRADVERLVRACIEKGMSLPGGEVAAVAALLYAHGGGPTAREWVQVPERRAVLSAAIRVVLADERMPPRERGEIRRLVLRFWPWSRGGHR